MLQVRHKKGYKNGFQNLQCDTVHEELNRYIQNGSNQLHRFQETCLKIFVVVFMVPVHSDSVKGKKNMT